MGRARIRCGQVWAGVGQVWADVGKGRIRCGQVWAGVGLALKLQVEMSGAGPGEASSRVCAADSTLGESSREAQSGRRLLGTNGGSLWLWCCLAQPGALGP